MRDGEFKFCPYCKEQIRASAIKCRYCGEWLDEQAESCDTGTVHTTEGQPTPPHSESIAAPMADLVRIKQIAGRPALDKTGEDVSPKPSAATGNFLGRHWRGEISLGVSFWVNGLLLSVAYVVAFAIAAQIGHALNPWLVVPILIGAFLISIIATCWQVVGVWRSSVRHAGRGGSPVVATVAKIVMVLWIAAAVKSLLTDWVSLGKGTYKAIAFHNTIPKCEIHGLPNGKEIEIRGGIPIGSGKKFRAVLDATPQAKVIRVNSIGGLITEAQTMGRLIRERGLNTYTDGCASAAVLVFLSGKERTVSDGAKVGFHSPKLFGIDSGEKEFSESMVRSIMRTAGISDEFITRVLAVPNDQLWYPTVAEMRLARIITKEDAPLKTFASNMASYLENPTNLDGFKPEPTGHDEVDRLMKSFAEFSRRWGGLFSEMNTGLERAGEPNVYSDQIIQDQEKIREALSIESKRKQINEDYRSKAHEEVKWLTNEFAGMKFSESAAKGMLKGMDRPVETGMAQANQLLSLRSDVETAKERFLSFMLGAFSDYKLINSKISFSKTEDVEQYKALTKAITDSTKTLEEFEGGILKSVDASKEQLKKLAK